MPVVSRLALTVDERRRTRRITSLLSLPDSVLLKILRLAHKGPRDTNRAIFSVCRRLSSLGKHLTLATISLRSTPSLVSLLDSSLSPIYHQSLAQHIRTIELFVVPQRHDILLPRHRQFRLPNLETVRFRFLQGVPLFDSPPEDLSSLLAVHTFNAQTKVVIQWQQFLACLNPRRFEWISPDAQRFHLAGLSTPFVKTIRSWERLESILLDGVCLVEQHDIAHWSLALLAKNVHIRGPFSNATSAPLYARGRIIGSPKCTRLLLENFSLLHPQFAHKIENEIPIIAFGNTTVVIKGFDFSSYQAIVQNLTDKRVWNFLQYRLWRHTGTRAAPFAPPATRPAEQQGPTLRARIWKRIKRELWTLWLMWMGWYLIRYIVLLGVAQAYPWIWKPTRVVRGETMTTIPYDPIQQPITKEPTSFILRGYTSPAPGPSPFYSW